MGGVRLPGATTSIVRIRNKLSNLQNREHGSLVNHSYEKTVHARVRLFLDPVGFEEG
jgi:hypothetical protein